MPFGSLVGALASSFIADKYSRKISIQIASVIWVIGSMYFSPIIVSKMFFLTCSQYPMRFSQRCYACRRTCCCWSLCRHCFIYLSCLPSRDRSQRDSWAGRQSSTVGHYVGDLNPVLYSIRGILGWRWTE
jgi:hypothetical protein